MSDGLALELAPDALRSYSLVDLTPEEALSLAAKLVARVRPAVSGLTIGPVRVDVTLGAIHRLGEVVQHFRERDDVG